MSVTPSSVKVAVMVRPLLPFEQQKGGSSSVVVYPPNKVSAASSGTQHGQPALPDRATLSSDAGCAGYVGVSPCMDWLMTRCGLTQGGSRMYTVCCF